MNDTAEIIAQSLLNQKELDYMLIISIVKEHMITWPENADSKLWNDRLESLLRRITEKFGFDGENE